MRSGGRLLPRKLVAGLSIAIVTAILLWGARPSSVRAQQDAGRRQAAAGDATAATAKVAALGRLEPNKGVIRVAGPSRPRVVVKRLFVERGDSIEEGQVIAELDTLAESKAGVARARARLANVEADLGRVEKLYRGGTTSVEARDDAQLAVDVARADLEAIQATLEMDVIRSPINGRVLDVHARGGERVGPLGVVELGETGQMYAIAEVYETDIGRVRVGQRATASSPALPEPLSGEVESIGLKIGKLDVFSTDPAANADARVVEVKIRLEDSARAAALTNLSVEVVIDSGDP